MTRQAFSTRRQRIAAERGQSLVEFAIVLPLLVVLALGVIEVSWALLDNHVLTKLSREGSNLISRDTSLQDAATAMRSMRLTDEWIVHAPWSRTWSAAQRASVTASSNGTYFGQATFPPAARATASAACVAIR